MLDSEKQARVDNVIKTLGLKRSENTLIGQPGGTESIVSDIYCIEDIID